MVKKKINIIDRQGNTDDLQRIYYYKHYINQVLKAVKEVKDGIRSRIEDFLQIPSLNIELIGAMSTLKNSKINP